LKQQKYNWLPWLWKIPGSLIEWFFGLLHLYVLSALIGMWIQVGEDYREQPDGITIYLETDGIHTNFVLPVRTAICDWSQEVRWKDLRGKDTSYRFLALGWGDQGFFLHTPEWSDLKFSTAFDALFYRGKSAMHAVYKQEPEVSRYCLRFRISKKQYQNLVTYIRDSFWRDKNGQAQVIAGKGYWEYDAFYPSIGKYSLFYTCNSWINEGLKAAELPACGWTPLSFGILEKYEED
jgi:uncharacterized protein (TIGR02117 family)